MANDREVTIYDIAEKLNISPATVSRGLQDHPAISKKTKKKIQDLAEKIGYRSNHFARNLRNQKTNTIGVIVPRLNSNFMSSVIAGIEQVANVCADLQHDLVDVRGRMNLVRDDLKILGERQPDIDIRRRGRGSGRRPRGG